MNFIRHSKININSYVKIVPKNVLPISNLPLCHYSMLILPVLQLPKRPYKISHYMTLERRPDSVT